MTELNQHLAKIEATIKHLEDSLQCTDDRMLGMELVLSWLLHKHPEHDVHLFLACQANNAASSQHLHSLVKLLDDLREQVAFLRASAQ